jgi:PPOX class probable F420-dependent enzyme
MGISDEKYLSMTTYRKNGTPVSTPIWIVDLGNGKLGFWTSSGSGKAKRLAHTSRVTLQPSDGRGKVKEGTTPTEATATLIGDGPELDEIRKAVVAKYGFMTKITKMLAQIVGTLKGKRVPYGDRGVVITLAPAA